MYSFKELRDKVWEANMELPRNNLVIYTFGNVSGIDRDHGIIAIKPSGVPYRDLTPDKIVLVDMDNNIIDSTYNPSTDIKTHMVLYQKFSSIGGVVHTHSPYATSFAVLGQTLPLCLTTLAMEFGTHIPVSEFAEIGGIEIGKQIVEKIGSCPAILMRNHGVFTVGATVNAALKAAIMLEEAAQTCHYAMLRGKIEELPQDVIDSAFKFYSEKYGQKGEHK